MALEGDLREFPLTDIIQLVDLSKKTGAVYIGGQRGVHRIEGKIYFRDGKISGADIANLPPLEAIYTCFTLESGHFRFSDAAEDTLEKPMITMSNEVIIMEGIMRQEAWAKTQDQEPLLDVVPRLIPNPATGSSEISLEAEEWRVLTMVNGKNTVRQIAQHSGLGETRTSEIVTRLLADGLIEKRATPPTEALLPEFEQITASVFGNKAPLLLQEACLQAGLVDLSDASLEHVYGVIDYLERSAADGFGLEQARRMGADLRGYAHEILGER